MNDFLNSREADITYKVQKGDSLYKIAAKFNVTADHLMKINNLTNTLLTIGQILLIEKGQNDWIPEHIGSDICGTYQEDDDSSSNEEYKYSTHIVQKGDNLYSIAKKYQTTVAELIYINNLTNELLSLGQILKVPPSSNSVSYIVKKGDTLYSIASNYNTNVEKLITINNLKSTTLTIGQKLVIPSTTNSPSLNTIYIVRMGDSLWSIAKKYNIKIDAITKANNLKGNILSIGQKLIIPV